MPVPLFFRLFLCLFQKPDKTVQGDSHHAQHGIAVQGKAGVHDKIRENGQERRAGEKPLIPPFFPHQQSAEQYGENTHDGAGHSQGIDIQAKELYKEGAEVSIKCTLLPVEVGRADRQEIRVAVRAEVCKGPGVQAQSGLVDMHLQRESADAVDS